MPPLLNWSFGLQIRNKQKQKMLDFFGKFTQPFCCFLAYLYLIFHLVILSLYMVICKPLSNTSITGLPQSGSDGEAPVNAQVRRCMINNTFGFNEILFALKKTPNYRRYPAVISLPAIFIEQITDLIAA